MKIVLVTNGYKREAVESALTLELWLTRHGYEVVWAPDNTGDAADKFMPECDVDGAELVVSLEATVRFCARRTWWACARFPFWESPTVTWAFLPPPVPRSANILEVLEDALAGELHVSRRATLSCEM